MNEVKPSKRGALSIARRGSILIVAINRPRLKNALNDAYYEDMIDIFDSSAADDSVSALVLTGVGSYYSSGADLSTTDFSVSGRDPHRKMYLQPAGRFMMAILSYPKVLAAAVNGPVVGIALAALMHCDLVRCSPTATFWGPFTRLALIPELCSSHTFISTMGIAKANEMLLLGKRVDAQTAVEYNIVSKIVHDVDTSGNPFHPNSLASQLCRDIDRSLLSLPVGKKTAEYFVSMIRGARRDKLKKICIRELVKFDERFNSGQVMEAASALKIGSKARKKRSRL